MTAPPRTAAFSLVEVMIAILILGVALAGLTMGITTALSSTKESELQTCAAMIAAGQMESLRADGVVTDGEEEGESEEGLSLYRWKQSVSSTEIDGLHEVKVTVENSKTSQPIYELRTLLFDPPVEREDELANSRKNSDKTEKRDRRDR